MSRQSELVQQAQRIGSGFFDVDASGRVLMPQQPAFLAQRTSHVTSSGNIVFDTKVFDVTNSYNNTTGVFTAPVTGRYFFSVSTLLYNLGGSTRIIIYVNGAAYGNLPTTGVYGAVTGSYIGQGGSLVVSAAAGDSVTAYCDHSTTSLHNSYTWWSGHLIG